MLSGGKIQFLDAVLNFPEGVGLIYATELFWNGPEAYEKTTSKLLALLIGRSRVFFDIGSNIGIYAVYAGVKFPAVTTYAFEPVPAIWKKNCLFHRSNQLSEKNVLSVALGDRQGQQELIIPLFDGAVEEQQTATLRSNTWQSSHETVERVSVECTTLDAFSANNAIPAGVCCLKIDVEDHEAAVLRGGRNFIQSRRPWIVCELLPNQKVDPATGTRMNDNAETLSLVEELAYTPFAITGDGLFRMTPADFRRPRELKDFVLAPSEMIAADVSYLAFRSLEEMLPLP